MNCGYWLVSLGLCCVELDVFVSEAGSRRKCYGSVVIVVVVVSSLAAFKVHHFAGCA